MRRLPPSATQDALQLADRYNAYLAQHDALLTAQNFPERPDPVRMAAGSSNAVNCACACWASA
jgi:hypothetical protein